MPKTKKKQEKGNIKPEQDIAASMAEELKGKLLKMVDEGQKKLNIDLAKVKTIDSVGLKVIISAHNTLKNIGGKLKLINASEDIVNLFKTMKLDQCFVIKMVE